MNKASIIRFQGLMNIAGGAGLLLWWFMMPLFLPVSEAAESFEKMVLHGNWVPVNLVGLLSVILLTLGFPGIYLASHEQTGRWGLAGMILGVTGLLLFTAVQYYETILWPAAGRIEPGLIGTGGDLVWGDPGVVAGLFASGVFLGAGYLVSGIQYFRKKTMPGWIAIMLIAGAVLFGNGVLFPVRTIGILMFGPATILAGIHIRKDHFMPRTS